MLQVIKKRNENKQQFVMEFKFYQKGHNILFISWMIFSGVEGMVYFISQPLEKHWEISFVLPTNWELVIMLVNAKHIDIGYCN